MKLRPLSSVAVLSGLGVWSLAFWVGFRFVPSASTGPADPEALQAAVLMARSIGALRERRDSAGPPIDARYDLNRTGLIGIEDSPITTSLGRLEAKRTTTNPNFAGAVVRMLREAGLKRGDVVAVGASSSFPGLILATLAAAEALGVKPLLVSSLGASNWGANHPDWTWLEMSDCLREKGLLSVTPIAFSIGGDGDSGSDMDAAGRELLERKILDSGRPFLHESGLADNVRARLAALDRSAGGKETKAFINVGGSWADMGTEGEVLKLRPGFNPASEVFVPAVERRGLIQEMARRGIPVIHLLYVKGLCDRYGLPWDPVPLPDPARASGHSVGESSRLPNLIAIGVYLAGMIFGLGWIAIDRRRLGM
jgi:poly-gamma-glutamate system protein